MTESADTAEIRTKWCPRCPLCGGYGKYIYCDQSDRMFGTSGDWNFKRCSNEQCRLIWLDPMPIEEDIGKAYARYYTHSVSEYRGRPRQIKGLAKSVIQIIKQEYISEKYGYYLGKKSFSLPFFGKLLYLFPLWRTEADGRVRLLHAVPGGRLLDVGCGSGDWLLSMQELGWDVVGIDFDEDAVKAGRQNGSTLLCGALEKHRFLNEYFDAITLNHVIEHVPDPIGTLRECARILKPGGKLVIFTPNGESLGRRIFGKYWRGLEPPRHLYIFALQSMRQVIGQAGFERSSVLPWVADSMIYESYLLWRGWRGPFVGKRRRRLAQIFAWLFSMAELLLIKLKPSVADCVAVIAVK